MARMLVLVRHAKAQARAEGVADIDRRLTGPGRRSCRASMAKVASLLAGSSVDPQGVPQVDRKGISLWSSPAARALQTAEILADALGLPAQAIRVHDSLYAADPAAFLAELSDEPGTVVAVGHNPFLEDVAGLLSGTEVVLDKSAAIAFELAGQGEKGVSEAQADDAPAELDWFVQGADHRRWSNLSDLEAACGVVAERIAENARWLSEEPDEPEALHQYRVSIRAARSVALFIAPYCKRPVARRLLGTLKELQAETSRLREYDVMHADLVQMSAAPAPGADGSAETGGSGCPSVDTRLLLGALIPVRDAERSRFNKYFARRKTSDAVRRAVSMLRCPAWRSGIERMGLAREDVCARFDELGRMYEQDLAACDFNDPEATHDIRKRSKQRRYVARDLAAILGEERAASSADAKATQDLLGRLCDARVNRDLACQLLGTPSSPDDGPEPGTFAAGQQAVVDELVAQLMP